MALVACGGDSESEAQTPTRDSGSAQPESGQPRVMEIQTSGIRFDPSTIALKAGESVQFKFTSNGTYTFTIPELGIDHSLSRGETVTTSPVTSQSSGTIRFLCRFHQSGGMEGELDIS